MLSRYPKGDKVPSALLKKGYSYLELGERSQGVVQLQHVIRQYPTSDEAEPRPAAACARSELTPASVRCYKAVSHFGATSFFCEPQPAKQRSEEAYGEYQVG